MENTDLQGLPLLGINLLKCSSNLMCGWVKDMKSLNIVKPD